MTRYGPTRSKPNTHAQPTFLRYAGIDSPASAVAQAAAARGDLPITFLGTTAAEGDFCLIDGALAVANELPAVVPPPQPGLGYAGFSAVQRAAFHAWLDHPGAPAPLAFQQLLLANAEVRLLEGGERQSLAHGRLLPLAAAPPWHGHAGLARTLLLSFWLRHDGPGLAQWLTSFALSADLWGVALGLQTRLAQPLQPDQLPALASAWELPIPAANEAVLRLRLASLQTVLKEEPLAHALRGLGDAAHVLLPWRCQHRDLRLALPQPDLRPTLEPLLRDLLAIAEPVPEPAEVVQPQEPEQSAADNGVGTPPAAKGSKKGKTRQSGRSAAEEKVHLILEFEASRSDVFDYVLRQAQKQPGFQQIMDENRHIIYRVPFRHKDMRHFWRLWDYVQNWASVRVYQDGRELDRWQVYPYSQYLR